MRAIDHVFDQVIPFTLFGNAATGIIIIILNIFETQTKKEEAFSYAEGLFLLYRCTQYAVLLEQFNLLRVIRQNHKRS